MNILPSFNELIERNKPVLVDFFATWCGPCMSMKPVLTQLAGELGGQAEIVEIDVDQHTPLAVQLGVMGVPTFMLFKNGQLLWKEPGVQSKETLKKVIEEHI